MQTAEVKGIVKLTAEMKVIVSKQQM